MRGSDAKSGSLFSYVDLDQRVLAKHPLRVIKALADDVLVSLDAEFERLYEHRPAVDRAGAAAQGFAAAGVLLRALGAPVDGR
jgi:hypothetical protein